MDSRGPADRLAPCAKRSSPAVSDRVDPDPSRYTSIQAAEHRAVVDRVYGESWVQPFRELYTWREQV
jgi:hypothetical protein